MVKTSHLKVEVELHKTLQQLQKDVIEMVDTANSEQEHAFTAKSSTLLTEIQQEIEQFATTKLATNIERKEAESQESDTPVEENEEGMLPEDDVLLTYILKQN